MNRTLLTWITVVSTSILLTACSQIDHTSTPIVNTEMAADLIVYNSQITTQNPAQPNAEALAVKDGKIIGVGDFDSLKSYNGANTQLIDGENRRLIPGLIDSHSHFLRSGLAYTRELRWDGVPDLKTGLAMIKEQAKHTPEGEWLRVIGGWTPWQFKEQRLPTIAELNEAAPNTPIYMQYFYSVGLLNKKGMELLGIDKTVKDPKGGRYVRDSQGNPTGLMLAEPHPGIFYGKIAGLPSASKEVETNSTIHLFHELAKFGLTSVIDAGGGGFSYPQEYTTAEQLAVDGKLPIRASFYLFAQTPGHEHHDFEQWSRENKAGTNTDPIKNHGFELDGGGEYLLWKAGDFENFRADRPELAAEMEAELAKIIQLLVERRWPFRIHATYDESITRILDVVEKVNQTTPLAGLRWSIEHAETIKEENIDRIIGLGGGVAIQDRMVFLGDDFVERYGEDAAKYSPPVKMLLEKGVPIGMGTDATRGSTFNPWIGLHYLITGETASGRKLYGQDNLLTREQALYVYTLGSAWFSGEEKVKGKIAVGQLADFTLLTQDYMAIPIDDIKTIRSVLTIVDGNVVYGTGSYAELSPVLPEILPAWSPVKRFGSYWQK